MRGDKEIRDLVTEIEQPFLGLRKKIERTQAQLYGHESYKNDLISALAEEIDTRIAVPSGRPSTVARQIQGIIRSSFSFHVNAAGKLERDERRADKRELYYAHEWATNLNRGGYVLRDTWRYQTVGPVAGWWLEYDAFALPQEEDKREQYRKDFAPFKLSVLDPSTFAFLADETGQPTISVRRFKLPYVEIAKRYGDAKKDPNPLTILNEQFGWLRGGQGYDPDGSDIHRKTAEVCVVDDGVTICHYIEALSDSVRFHQVGVNGEPKDFPNPWGSNSLRLIFGVYNADAKELEDKYRGLLDEVLREQRNLDVLDSHIASIILTPTKHAQVLPEQIAHEIILSDKAMPKVQYDQTGWTSLVGDHVDIGTEIPQSVMDLRTTRAMDRDAALPSPFLTNPDESTVKEGTAAAQLNAHETSNRTFDEARESVIAGMVWVCTSIDHFVKGGGMPNKGAVSPEVLHFTVVGSEPSKKYAGARKGEELEFGPEDIDDRDVLEITQVATTESQKMLRYQLKSLQQKEGYATRSEVLEVLTEDVTGAEDRLEEEARYQMYGPMIDKADLLGMVEAIKLDSGGAMDLSYILTPDMAGMPVNQPSGAPASSDGMSVQATAPPPTQVSSAEAMG